MAEVTIRACLDCPTEIVIPPGRGQKPKRCKPCKAINQKARDADRHRLKQAAIDAARRDAPPTFTCLDCEGIFPRTNRDGPTPRRCETCGRRRRLDQLIAVRHAQTDERRAAKFRCEICLLTFPVLNRQGPIPRICEGCRSENRRRTSRAAYMEKVSPIRHAFTCLDCNGEFLLASRKGYSRRRCDDCGYRRQLSQSQAWLNARPEMKRAKNRENRRRRRVIRRSVLAERFTDREIFDRDGWLCGLCGLLVDRALLHPDLMAASLDHIIPVVRGGHHTRRNVRCTHALCNSRKTNRLDSEILHVFPYLAAKLAA